MTASISYAPVSRGTHLDVGGAPSIFVEQMKKVFGDQPWTIDSHDYDKLHTLAALWNNSGDNPYDRLIDVVRESGPVEVWVTY